MSEVYAVRWLRPLPDDADARLAASHRLLDAHRPTTLTLVETYSRYARRWGWALLGDDTPLGPGEQLAWCATWDRAIRVWHYWLPA